MCAAKLLSWVLCGLLFLLVVTPAQSCPFCGMAGQTLTQEADQSVMILYGTLKIARRPTQTKGWAAA